MYSINTNDITFYKIFNICVYCNVKCCFSLSNLVYYIRSVNMFIYCPVFILISDPNICIFCNISKIKVKYVFVVSYYSSNILLIYISCIFCVTVKNIFCRQRFMIVIFRFLINFIWFNSIN